MDIWMTVNCIDYLRRQRISMENITITREFVRKAKELSPAALVLALQLADNVGTGGFVTDSKGKPMIIEDIHETSGYSVRTTKRTIS